MPNIGLESPIARQLSRQGTPRPCSFETFVGNEAAVAEIQEALTAAKKQGIQAPHTLLFGSSGAGKTSLARLMAHDMGGTFFETAASSLETPMNVCRILYDMNAAFDMTGKPSVLFIDEIHGLAPFAGRSRIDQEALFPLLEDGWMPHNLIGKKFTTTAGEEGVFTNTKFYVAPFTMIGATTEPGALSAPLRRRFLLHVHIRPYTETDITQIIAGSAHRLGWGIEPDASTELAKYSRCSPGRSNQLLQSARSRAVATERETITVEVVREIVARMGLYRLGLDEYDIAVLRTLADRPKGVGASELACAVGVNRSTFEELIEPYLRLLGMVVVMSRRQITPRGLSYLASIGTISPDGLPHSHAR